MPKRFKSGRERLADIRNLHKSEQLSEADAQIRHLTPEEIAAEYTPEKVTDLQAKAKRNLRLIELMRYGKRNG